MPKNMELTTTEKSVLEHYLAFENANGEAPSINWLAQRLGLHPNSIRHAFKRMKEKGYMREQKITVTRLTLSAKAKKAAP